MQLQPGAEFSLESAHNVTAALNKINMFVNWKTRLFCAKDRMQKTNLPSHPLPSMIANA